MFFLLFSRFTLFPQATILRLRRLFTNEATEVATGSATSAPKPVAALAELGLEVEEVKKLPEEGAWRWLEPGNEACRRGSPG